MTSSPKSTRHKSSYSSKAKVAVTAPWKIRASPPSLQKTSATATLFGTPPFLQISFFVLQLFLQLFQLHGIWITASTISMIHIATLNITCTNLSLCNCSHCSRRCSTSGPTKTSDGMADFPAQLPSLKYLQYSYYSYSRIVQWKLRHRFNFL